MLQHAAFAVGRQGLDWTSVAASLLVGLFASAVVAWVFWKSESKRERGRALLRTGNELAHNCQELLELASKALLDLAARKHEAHQIATTVASLTGEPKRITADREVMQIERQEIPSEAVDALTIALRSHVHPAHKTEEDERLVSAAGEAAAAAQLLADELGSIDRFSVYYRNVAGRAATSTLEEFVAEVEGGEVEMYQPILDHSAATRTALSSLIKNLKRYSASGFAKLD